MKLVDPTDDSDEHFAPEVEKVFACSSIEMKFELAVQSSHGTAAYQVTYEPENGWSCECTGFQYRQRCKHVELAKTKVCHWNASRQALGEPAKIAGQAACPLCKGDVIEVTGPR